MAGRLFFVAALAALLATSAAANDRACTRETVGRIPALTALQLEVDQIFDRMSTPTADTAPGEAVEFPVMEVLMVRIKDGKPVIACVDSKEAAQRFLNAPIGKIGMTRTAEEK